MDTDGQELRLEGPTDLEFVDRVVEELERFWPRVTSATAEDRLLFTLAVTEIATNVVQHAAAERSSTMHVDVRATATEVQAEIRDGAAPAAIDWSEIAMPDALSESGRGLALAQAALDAFEHRHDGSGNIWTLRRALSGGS